MPFSVNITDPLGGLDKDTDLAKVRDGDYTDALNVQHLSEGGQTSRAIENTLGNTLRFNIPDTVQQNKTYRIHLGSDGVTNHTINFFWTNGATMAAATFTEGANIPATQTNLKTAVTAALAAALYVATGIPQTVSYTDGSNYTEITITTVLGYDWSLTTDAFGDAIITQEAESLSLLGEANIIGSFDLLGDLFIWSTSQKNLPSTTAVSGATNASPIVITHSASVEFQTGQEITIASVLGNTAANGKWIITVLSSTTFSLRNSSGNGAYTSGGTITSNFEGIGEIGVATYDVNTDATTYYTLLKSKEFNFTTKHQIDTYCEANNFRQSLYWTDDYNVPRVLYYDGAYMTNGALSYVNTDGLYEYGSIDSETRLILTNDLIGFSFSNQLQSGGGLLSGNWRYAVRLLTQSFNPTNWTDLINPVNVYSAGIAVPSDICGDDAATFTGKINEFTLTDLPVDVFKYVELAAVYYTGTAVVGQIVKRVPIVSASMTIQHLGTETGVTNLDVATLNGTSFDINTAKNIDAIDSRLILSNLTTSASIDFSPWTATWTHSLYKEQINAVKYKEAGTFRYAEYVVPENVNTKVGYMLSENYRFFAKFKLRNGLITKSFWIDDITFNTLTPARRNNTLTNYDLTDAAGDTVYIPAVEFETIDLNYLIEGVPVKDLVEAIFIERVECVPEILFSGIGVLGIRSNALVAVVTMDASVDGSAGAYDPTGGPAAAPYYTGEHLPFYVDAGASPQPLVYGTYPNTTKMNSYVALYSPDYFYGETGFSFLSGDQIINMDQPPIPYYSRVLANPADDHYYSLFFEMSGQNATVTPQVVNISDANIIDIGSVVTFTGGTNYCKKLYRGAAVNNDYWGNITTPVLKLASGLTHSNANTDLAYYQVQVKRAITDKYGAISSNQTIPTGAFYKIDSSSPAILPIGSGIKTLGGDVFTQKSYINNRFTLQCSSFAGSLGWAQGFSFYSQNRVNAQMTKRYNNSTAQWQYPRTTVANWLSNLTYGAPEYDHGYDIRNEISVNVAFDSSLPDQSDLPAQIRYSDLKPQGSIIDNFRTFLPLNFKDLPDTWGEITHHANFNGELFTWQPRMVQRQYFNTRGTMNVDGNGGSTQVLIGDGTVFSRDGQMVTRIGTYNKWSVVKGKSAQGNDSMYWLNTELNKAMRMGYDGTISIGDIHGMRSYFANNLNWVEGKDTPADGEGICGVWDDRYAEAIWTVRGKRVFETWFGDDLDPWVVGNIVSFIPIYYLSAATNASPIAVTVTKNHGFITGQTITIVGALGNTAANGTWVITKTGNTTFTLNGSTGNGAYTMGGTIRSFSTFEQTGEIYVCIQNTVGTGANQPPPLYGATSAYWTMIPHTGSVVINGTTYYANDYYNEYTLAYNEQKNKFTSFYTFKPKIYLKWTETFLTPRPVSDTGNVYEHRLGRYCIWYAESGVYQSENGYIELLFNRDENLIKEFFATLINSEIIPFRIDYTTKQQQTFVLAADFERDIDFWTAAVKNDILTSSTGLINDEDTSRLFGQWIKVKVSYEIDVYQKVVDIVTKYLGVSRTYTK